MNYILCDNGIRCFVPPCFSWDVYSIETRKLIERVSLLDISSKIAGMTMEQFLSQPHCVTGYIKPGEVVKYTGKQHRILYIQDAHLADNEEFKKLQFPM